MKTCPKCDVIHDKIGIYCSHSCANRMRSHSTETRAKISKSRAGTKATDAAVISLRASAKIKQSRYIAQFNSLNKICKVCKVPMTYDRRKNVTCGSKTCVIRAVQENRKYHNGRRKTFYYENLVQGKIVLESSWELIIAEYLDSKNIKWIRPEPIKWINFNNVNKLYYPDFYLNDYNHYLDPKNPYCLSLDKEKIEIVSKQIKLTVGNVEEIKSFIDSLK